MPKASASPKAAPAKPSKAAPAKAPAKAKAPEKPIAKAAPASKAAPAPAKTPAKGLAAAKPAAKAPAAVKTPAKGVTPVAKPVPTPSSKSASPKTPAKGLPAAPAPKLNGHSCPFSAQELREWREQLVERRHEIAGDIESLERDVMEAEDGHIAPTHQADRGSDADLQDTNLRMVENEQELLWQIDRAIRKIDTSRPLPFGLCEHTQKPIPQLRLQLVPWTPLSIEGAQHMEDEGLAIQDLLIED